MSAIDPRAFYVEELESFVNLTEDYIMWHELRHAPPAQRRPFVFCDHPFLFDPPLKSKVLRLEYSILSAAQQGAPRLPIRSASARFLTARHAAVSLFPVCLVQVRRSNLMEDALRFFAR
jgi:hypothetical protein